MEMSIALQTQSCYRILLTTGVLSLPLQSNFSKMGVLNIHFVCMCIISESILRQTVELHFSFILG